MYSVDRRKAVIKGDRARDVRYEPLTEIVPQSPFLAPGILSFLVSLGLKKVLDAFIPGRMLPIL